MDAFELACRDRPNARISLAKDIHLRDPPSVEPRGAAPSVTAVIPTLNEARNIAPVVQGLPSCVDEIIIVDGRSEDGTVDVALRADPRVQVVLEQRRGKGAAMLTGFAAATGGVIVAMDADGSMDPGEIPMFQAALGRGYDFVKGSREAVGGGSQDFSPLRRGGNNALTRLANVIHRNDWTDMCYGYFAFWRDVLPVLDMRWEKLTTRALAGELEHELSMIYRKRSAARGDLSYGHGFEIETVLFLRAARARLRIAELPSIEHPRATGESNLRTFRDGTRVLGAIARERTRRAVPSWAGDPASRKLRIEP
jgi:glycosyltransferase involved in cell wall biosynthesis